MAKLLITEDTVKSAVQILKESIEVASTKENPGLPLVAFKLAEGRGTGTQFVNAEDYGLMLSVLREKMDNPAAVVPEAELPAYEVIRRTFKVDDENNVMFRTSIGKGAKPVKFGRGQLPEVIEMLTRLSPIVETAAREIDPDFAYVETNASADDDRFIDDDSDDSDNE